MSDIEIKTALNNCGVVFKENHNFIESYGLGLRIVKMLLDAHDATLTISSKANIGTVIKITFPKYKIVYNAKI
jgi:signal transduction histidine kinase